MSCTIYDHVYITFKVWIIKFDLVHLYYNDWWKPNYCKQNAVLYIWGFRQASGIYNLRLFTFLFVFLVVEYLNPKDKRSKSPVSGTNAIQTPSNFFEVQVQVQVQIIDKVCRLNSRNCFNMLSTYNAFKIPVNYYNFLRNALIGTSLNLTSVYFSLYRNYRYRNQQE